MLITLSYAYMKDTQLQFSVSSFYPINLSTSFVSTWLGRRSACAGTTNFRLISNGVSSMDSSEIFHNKFSSSTRRINVSMIIFLKITPFWDRTGRILEFYDIV